MKIHYKVKDIEPKVGVIYYFLGGNHTDNPRYCLFRIERIEYGKVYVRATSGATISYLAPSDPEWRVKWRPATEDEISFYNGLINNT